eukprot:Rmarinus@m.22796
MSAVIRPTPGLAPDTDGSQLAHKLTIVSLPAGVSFVSLTGTFSSISGGWYTLSSLDGGFHASHNLTELSMLPSVESDVDFTVTVSTRLVESNGLDESASESRSVGIVVFAATDQPTMSLLHRVSTLNTTEDKLATFGLIPSPSADSDLSEQLLQTSVVVSGSHSVTFSGLEGTLSAFFGNMFTVFADDTSGFVLDSVMSYSVTPAVHSDTDFTLLFSAISFEKNGGDKAESPPLALPLAVYADADSSIVFSQSNMSTTEDSTIEICANASPG